LGTRLLPGGLLMLTITFPRRAAKNFRSGEFTRMSSVKEQSRFFKYWFAFFSAHLFLLLFAVLNVYASRWIVNEPPGIYVKNELFFTIGLLAGVCLFGVSTFFKKTFRGFVWSLAFSLAISLTGLVVLFSIDSFYFLLWFIIGLSGMGIQLFRFRNSLEKN
jgi:hypothetical protein